MLIESEEDLEREVIEAEQHSSISINVSRITQLLEVCTTVKPPTKQTPPQHNSEDVHSDASSQQSTQKELPAITDDTPPTDDPLLISRHPDTLRAQEITCLPKLSILLFSGNV